MKRGPKPSVRYWESRKAYCCWVGDKRETLAVGPDDAPDGPTYLEALAKFVKLFAMEANKGTDDYLVSSLLNHYRAHLKATRKSAVPGVFEVMARGFSAKFGHLKVCDLKPFDFDEWLRAQIQWNDTSKAHAVALILAALTWAKRKDFIKTHPLAGKIERPQPLLRGRDARMSEELMDLLISECFERGTYNRKNKTDKPAVHLKRIGFCETFGKFLWLLRLTGARPIELRMAEAHNYENGRFVFKWNATKGYLHKTSKKTQRDRVIFLTPEAQEYTEACIKKFPSGPIFRTYRNTPWSGTNFANKWRGWLLKRPRVIAHLKERGIDPKQIRMCNFRHSWASNYLDKTGDIFGASMMLGSSVKMLQKRYYHMDEQKIHDRYLTFMSGQAPIPAPQVNL